MPWVRICALMPPGRGTLPGYLYIPFDLAACGAQLILS